MLDKGAWRAEKLKMETHVSGKLQFSAFFVFKTKDKAKHTISQEIH